ncbi:MULTISPECIES: hypothetical protein [Bacillaceae]|uniref:hypothetical protein n=1 Tax=Bacillaceae TaxID=186817 RepID=UPI00036DF70C|nr:MULTISPECIES: hypothetical protein [Bacillaceae]
MGPLTVIILFLIIMVVGFFFVYFLRDSFDFSDSNRIDKFPDNNDSYFNQDSSYEQKL